MTNYTNENIEKIKDFFDFDKQTKAVLLDFIKYRPIENRISIMNITKQGDSFYLTYGNLDVKKKNFIYSIKIKNGIITEELKDNEIIINPPTHLIISEHIEYLNNKEKEEKDLLDKQEYLINKKQEFLNYFTLDKTPLNIDCIFEEWSHFSFLKENNNSYFKELSDLRQIIGELKTINADIERNRGKERDDGTNPNNPLYKISKDYNKIAVNMYFLIGIGATLFNKTMFFNIFDGINLNKENFLYGKYYKIEVIKKINYTLTKNENEPINLQYYFKEYGNHIADIPNIEKKKLKYMVEKNLNISEDKEYTEEEIKEFLKPILKTILNSKNSGHKYLKEINEVTNKIFKGTILQKIIQKALENEEKLNEFKIKCNTLKYDNEKLDLLFKYIGISAVLSNTLKFSNEEIENILKAYNKMDFIKKEQYQDLLKYLNDNLSKDDKYKILVEGISNNETYKNINSIITNFIMIYAHEDFKNFKNILPNDYKTLETLIKMAKKDHLIKENLYFLLFDFLYSKLLDEKSYFNDLDKKLLAGSYKGEISEEEMNHFDYVIGRLIEDFMYEYIPKY